MSTRAMIILIFPFFALISLAVHGSLITTDHQYHLMHYTKLISEEHFTAGRPLVLMLPLAEEESTKNEVGYLIKELHKSGRWPILVYNVNYMVNENMHTEIHPHGNYIILMSGRCKEWEEHIARFRQQLYELSLGNNTWHSWNPRGKFIFSVMSNCINVENTKFSGAILNEIWLKEVMNAAVLFLNSNEHASNDLQQKTNDPAQGTYLELHTWYPYENSERCNPAEGTVPVKVFTMRSLSDIRRSDIFRGQLVKNFHGCPMRVNVRVLPPFVNEPENDNNKDYDHQKLFKDGWEIEMLRIIGNKLNMSLDIAGVESVLDVIYFEEEVQPFIFVGGFAAFSSDVDNFCDYSRSYFTARAIWYTPCAVKYQRWTRFFNILSVDMWICFVLSLVLAVATVSCISNYSHKSHSHESKSYSNIFSVTSNIIAVSLSVSVNTQPRSAPLRLFFFSWVCYSFAISTVFQAYLIAFLFEPGYEKPIRTVEEMLKSEKLFAFPENFLTYFYNTSGSVDSAVRKGAVHCQDEYTCLTWATVYHNISTILSDFDIEIERCSKNWIDENNRPILCELEDGVVRTIDLVFLVRKRSPFLEILEDVIGRIIEGGIFARMKEQYIDEEKLDSNFYYPTSDDTYFSISVSHLQTAIYLLLLGYVLALGCFVTEIMWHHYRSKWFGQTNTAL